MKWYVLYLEPILTQLMFCASCNFAKRIYFIKDSNPQLKLVLHRYYIYQIIMN